ncbi:MAG: hydroxysqualene dehydroxylase HpnE [Burkholderiaceae bacterium]|nr:hydroxysqualene dehydroxylase HpnE [Burkholderiaceae bacterium]
MKVAVIGAGWAGMAAALAHTARGHQTTVLEASRSLGGRARALPCCLPDGQEIWLDNGQHLLIGAYAECLRLLRLVGVSADQALLRLPLALSFPDGSGLRLPDLPPPWDALWGIARARGWSWRDRAALLRTASAWRGRGFRCAPQTTVAALCAGLTPRLRAEFIEPLCVSALNTPADQACGQVFLRVLQDSLFSGRGGSNLLLPRCDLGALFPDAAAQWLRGQGGEVRTGQRVQSLAQRPDGRWQVDCGGASPDGTDAPEAVFDHLTLACPPWEAARLVAGAAGLPAAQQAAARQWSACAGALRFEAITTVYALAPGVRLAQPLLALRSTAGQPAQFVIDRGQLGGPPGLLAFVVSASQGERAALERQVLEQARVQLALPVLQAVQTVVEKRATFACTPGLQRPATQVLPGLSACGDYVQGPYPATLEGAVLSGQAAAQQACRDQDKP